MLQVFDIPVVDISPSESHKFSHPITQSLFRQRDTFHLAKIQADLSLRVLIEQLPLPEVPKW